MSPTWTLYCVSIVMFSFLFLPSLPPPVVPCPRALEVKRKAVQRIEEQLMKLQVQATDREENKQIALGTSKLNYLDPRISVAWYEPAAHLHLLFDHRCYGYCSIGRPSLGGTGAAPLP